MGRYVNFNQSAYIKDLTIALHRAMDKVTKEVMSSILANFGALNIRELDKKYLASMQNSIRYAKQRTVDKIITSFIAGHEFEPNQSFRVVYYEYGTGEKMQPPRGYLPMLDKRHWNPARRDLRIWQRPRGKWVDHGGNVHTSRTKGEPRPISPKSPLAQPIEPSWWFSRGFWEGTANLDRYLHEAVKSVPITAYISIAKIHKRL